MNKTNIKTSNIILIVVTVLIFAYFLLYGIRNITVCNNIQSKNLIEYHGNVEVSKEVRTRNTVYFLKLDNGDIIRVNPDLFKQNEDLKQYEQLSIKYSEPKHGIKRAYSAVEINAVENDTTLLDSQASYDEAKGGAYIGFAFSGVTLLILIVPCLGFALVKKSSNKKNRGKG